MGSTDEEIFSMQESTKKRTMKKNMRETMMIVTMRVVIMKKRTVKKRIMMKRRPATHCAVPKIYANNTRVVLLWEKSPVCSLRRSYVRFPLF